MKKIKFLLYLPHMQATKYRLFPLFVFLLFNILTVIQIALLREHHLFLLQKHLVLFLVTKNSIIIIIKKHSEDLLKVSFASQSQFFSNFNSIGFFSFFCKGTSKSKYLLWCNIWTWPFTVYERTLTEFKRWKCFQCTYFILLSVKTSKLLLQNT